MIRPTRTLPGGRVQPGALPRGENGRPLCRWCELEILASRRRTFCSAYCVDQWRLRTDPGYVRDRVFARDHGVCALCQADTVAIYTALKRSRGTARAAGLSLYGLRTITSRRSLWDADHIVRSPRVAGSVISTTCVRFACRAIVKRPRIFASGYAGQRRPPRRDALLRTGSALHIGSPPLSPA